MLMKKSIKQSSRNVHEEGLEAEVLEDVRDAQQENEAREQRRSRSVNRVDKSTDEYMADLEQ